MTPSRLGGRFSILIWVLALYVAGCASKQPSPAPVLSRSLNIDSVLVVPFKLAMHGNKISTTVHCSICGAVFQTGPVEAGVDTYMTKQLVAFLKAKTSYTLIPPGAAEGMRFQIISEDVSISERLLLVETGKRLHADAVISGTIYRFRQRIGTVFSVDTPASVAFGIHLIRVADGRLIWGRHFDETQQGLSENLFKLGTFLDRGGGWLTAEELAMSGLQEMMASFPRP